MKTTTLRPGDVYGRLTLERHIPGRESAVKHCAWECRCSCGNRKQIRADYIRNGTTTSCGCYRREGRITHGNAKTGAKTPEYRAWTGMLKRCRNPRYEYYRYYGGRGIKVCDKWEKSFDAFLADVGLRPTSAHSLDRFPDNNGTYEPGNCRWATKIEQTRNRRTSCRITYGGTTKHIVEWAEQYGIKPDTIRARLKGGWSTHRALTAPVMTQLKPAA